MMHCADTRDHEAEQNSRVRICKRLRSPGIDSASLCRLAGRYDKVAVTGPPGWESIPGLLKRFTKKGSGRCWNTNWESRSESLTYISQCNASYVHFTVLYSSDSVVKNIDCKITYIRFLLSSYFNIKNTILWVVLRRTKVSKEGHT